MTLRRTRSLDATSASPGFVDHESFSSAIGGFGRRLARRLCLSSWSFCTKMTFARHIISLLCVATAVVAAVLTGIQRSDGAQVQLKLVVFCALCFLAGVGVIGFALQFFTKNAGHILNCIFFGFFAGIMATNFIVDVASGTTFHSLSGYMISYGFMVFFFALSVVGLILLCRTEDTGIAEQCAAPSGGPATSLGNSGVTGRPPSVS